MAAELIAATHKMVVMMNAATNKMATMMNPTSHKMAATVSVASYKMAAMRAGVSSKILGCQSFYGEDRSFQMGSPQRLKGSASWGLLILLLSSGRNLGVALFYDRWICKQPTAFQISSVPEQKVQAPSAIACKHEVQSPIFSLLISYRYLSIWFYIL